MVIVIMRAYFLCFFFLPNVSPLLLNSKKTLEPEPASGFAEGAAFRYVFSWESWGQREGLGTLGHPSPAGTSWVWWPGAPFSLG